jgi:hypothetical protein
MDRAERGRLARRLLEGYVNGPDAATQATAQALVRAEDAATIVFVEGVSDQMAVETVAERQGIDLGALGVAVLPVGGAHGLARYAVPFGPLGAGARLLGLCDAAEEEVYRRAVARAGIGSPETRAELADLGFFVCDEDLEDEFIRVIGEDGVEALFASQGDLGSFRSLRSQPVWRDRPIQEQMHRFLGSGGQRKLRYARLFAASVDLARLPDPLRDLLARAQSPGDPP